MKLTLAGKVILVTGATQGVGEGVARAAAEAGCAGLVLTGRSAARGDALAKDLSKTCPAIFVAADLADPVATKRVVAEGAKKFPTIDGLVNAAGLTDRGTIFDTSVELWDLLYAVNVRAPFILTQEIATRLRDQKKPGSIVNVITMSSHGGQPFLTAYSSSKGALATLTKNTAHALRKNRIRVNGLNIGWMDTPGEHAIKAREGQPDNWLALAEKSQPFGRLLKPKDAAVLAVYLLSDASELVTGSVIDVDQNVMGAYDSKTGLLIAFFVVFLLLALAGAAWLLAGLDSVSIGVHGWVALTLGVVFSLAVGGGLMALVFISSRRGHDEKVHDVRPDDQA